jgi:GNAT superfamily N-acetyltransferase
VAVAEFAETLETVCVGAVEVRLVRPGDDLAAAGDIVRAAYFALADSPRDEHYDREIGDIAARVEMTDVVVAVLDGRLVGCLTYVPNHTNPHAEHGDEGAASFRYFGVDPTAHGRGLGEATVRFVIERARSQGKERLRIHTLTMMHRAMRLYVRLGFRRDPSYDQDWDGIVGVAYVFDL